MVESDGQLVVRCRAGDREAFAVLVQRYERPALAVAAGMLRSWHDAADAVQDAFTAAWQNLNRLWRPNRFGPWLMRIVRRTALRQLRGRRRRHDGIEQAAAVPAGPGTQPSPAWLDLLTLISRLPAQERVVIGLRHLDGLDVAEVAAATGRPLGTVTKQLSRAYARLGEWLKDEVDHGRQAR